MTGNGGEHVRASGRADGYRFHKPQDTGGGQDRMARCSIDEHKEDLRSVFGEAARLRIERVTGITPRMGSCPGVIGQKGAAPA